MSGRFFTLVCCALVALGSRHATAQATPCSDPSRSCVAVLDSSIQSFRIALGSFDREALTLGMALDAGDELISSGGGVALELSCPNGAIVKFSGPVRATVLPPSQTGDCAIALASGSLDILTDAPTTVQSGEVTLGSERTVYAVRVSHVAQRPTRELLVYDGDVSIRSPQASEQISAGHKVQTRGLAIERQPINRADIDRAATVYANIDLLRARVAGTPIEDPAATSTTLRTSYANVFSAPANPAYQLDIAVQQVNLRIPNQALYHLRRADQHAPTENSSRAMIALTRSVAYHELGNREQATVQYEEAKRIDPQVIQQSRITAYKLNPRLIEPIQAHELPVTSPMTMTAIAVPSTIRAGAATTIRVHIASSGGVPMPDASIRVSAGGGAFGGNQGTEVSGTTNARGDFMTTWTCAPCAPAYVLQIAAEKPGYQSATRELRVQIQ